VAEREYYRLDLVFGVAGDESAKGKLKAMDRFIEQTRRRGETLNRLRMSPTARLIDQVSGPAKKIEASLNRLGNVAKRVTGVLKSPLTLVGIGAGFYGLGTSFSKAMSFEAQMSSIKALTGLTAEEMQDMQRLAMEMGAKTKFSALEAAKGMEELLKAGLTPAQVKTGALEAALNLATAGELELAEAAEVMSTSLNAFKADGLSAAAASNILAGTANASATSVKELNYALSQVSAVASGIGMSMRDTNAALGLFANNGLKGSDAGTSLKTMLSNLQPATKEQIEVFKKLGVVTASGTNKFFTAEGKLQSLTSIAETLNDALKGMTDQMRMAYLEKMFGSDAIRAANIIFKEGPQGVKKFLDEMSKVTALEVAREKMNNAAGAVEQFKGALETLQISAMLPFLPTIKRIANGAADFTDRVSPRIVSSMESAAKKVEGFFNKLDQDEKFQQLDWGEKISYALDQIIVSANNWLDGEGGKQLEMVTGKIGQIMSAGLAAAAPMIAEGAIVIGKAVAEGIWSGFTAALKDSFLGSILIGMLGGGAIGSVVPGVGTVLGGISGGVLTGGAHLFNKYIFSPAVNATQPKKNAIGGIFNKPLGLVAEAGPEAIIPLSGSMRPRALSLWNQVGNQFGFNGMPTLAGTGGGTVINVYLDGAVQAQIDVRNDSDAEQAANRAAAIIAGKLKGIFTNKA